MEHVGDITKLRGGALPPVDIITFGSPCQDMSVAGRRSGLRGERSCLFYEAIRIIREMREATDEKYPTWAVWENVPGSLSSSRGLDFQAVLEAFAETEIPLPGTGRWANAGMVRGGRSDIAWVVYNAQHFGVPQRRRRVFLVADFAEKRAGEILFVPQSLRGYFAARTAQGQGAAAYVAGGADGAEPIKNVELGIMNEDAGGMAFACNERDEVRDLHDLSATLCAQPGMKQQTFIAKRGNCLTPWDTQQVRIFTEDGASPALTGADGGGGRNPAGLIYTAGFCAGAGAKANGIGYEEETAPTIKAGACGFPMPTVLCASQMDDSADSSHDNEYSAEAPCLCSPQLARTLTARGDSSPCADRGANIVVVPKADGDAEILCTATGQPNAETLENLSPTLTCYHEQPILCGAVREALGVSQNHGGDINTSGIAYSLTGNGNATSRNAPLVAHPAVSGTLMASGAGLSRPAGMSSEGDLCVVIPEPSTDCVPEPIPIQDKATRGSGGGPTRNDDGCGNGLGVGKEGDPFPTLTSGDRHAVAAVSAVDCRNYKEVGDISGTLQAKNKPGYSLHFQNPVRTGYIVRRLTPTECERLQGFPDGWTATGHEGKPISDTARYMMLGNSVAVPCVAYILQAIVTAHRREGREFCERRK